MKKVCAMDKVITIDGPAGAGKSTVSKALAARLGYVYLDTGALYRALAYKALRDRVATDDPDALAKLCATTDVTLHNVDGHMTVYVDGEEVGGKIRTEEVGLAASSISAFPVVREKLLSLQRDAGAREALWRRGGTWAPSCFPMRISNFFWMPTWRRESGGGRGSWATETNRHKPLAWPKTCAPETSRIRKGKLRP